MSTNELKSEDILSDALEFLGGKPVIEDDKIHYGPLVLTLAPKQGKANTLLADHLFSPALFLAERIELNLLGTGSKTVIELGAGCGLPSLLLSTQPDPPSLIVLTDYPDDNILGNLKMNVDRNQHVVSSGCIVKWAGYKWGTDHLALLNLINAPSSANRGYDVMILSDLLHFADSHDMLISSITRLLAKKDDARVYIGAGNYTHHHVCRSFLEKGKEAKLIFDEIMVCEEDKKWRGKLAVSTLDNEALELRKNNCRYWVGRWSD
ncbi:hypothetical protein HYPSUDRAFT_40248 [Hypholoma sublateritium FD-334 SS-4]|uniref:Nicotinamide N-methyltransferase n=1 Tax=Hypholoma sublateritium (strain FD-334 SS-4) TaxID=945553 RepID=A0A0D2NWG0_HYPSF|nr:hypothetical protein HYPSUDRAFT_40248 [Hypholoma sublateritium FD-334 SS-4]